MSWPVPCAGEEIQPRRSKYPIFEVSVVPKAIPRIACGTRTSNIGYLDPPGSVDRIPGAEAGGNRKSHLAEHRRCQPGLGVGHGVPGQQKARLAGDKVRLESGLWELPRVFSVA